MSHVTLTDRALDYPEAGIVTRAYDDAGRLASVTDPTARTSTFSYDADDNLSGRALANGTTEASGFPPKCGGIDYEE